MGDAQAPRSNTGFFLFLNLFRWLNWALALLLLYLGAIPKTAPLLIFAVYLAVLLYNSIFSIWPHQVRGALQKYPFLLAGDILFCWLLLVAFGWGSPFYVYSFSPVMLAGYLFKLRGSFLVAGISAAGYGLAVSITGRTWSELVGVGEIDTHLFQVFDYFLVAIFFSYPAVLAEQLRQSNFEMLQAQDKIASFVMDKERRRLAEDIHDSVTQSLLGLNSIIDSCADDVRDNSGARKRLSLAKEASNQALAEMRQSIDDLWLDKLEKITIKKIASESLARLEMTHGLKTDLTVVGVERDVDVDLKKAVYLIIQESLNNVVKHAKAKTVGVSLTYAEDQLVLDITDDGIGFNKRERSTGYGLSNISRRCAALSGTCELSSAIGRGTKVAVTVPIRAAAAAGRRASEPGA